MAQAEAQPWQRERDLLAPTSSGISVPIGLTFAGCRNGGRSFGALRMRSNTKPVDG